MFKWQSLPFSKAPSSGIWHFWRVTSFRQHVGVFPDRPELHKRYGLFSRLLSRDALVPRSTVLLEAEYLSRGRFPGSSPSTSEGISADPFPYLVYIW